jgi:CheY-like chemotaxis protein
LALTQFFGPAFPVLSVYNYLAMAIRNVLFVEKRKDVLKALQILLQHRGYEVIASETPAEAARHAHKADVLVISGVDPTCEDTSALLAHYRGTTKPTIAITSFAMPHNIEELRSTGFDEVITEPINLERLVGAIQKFDGMQRT